MNYVSESFNNLQYVVRYPDGFCEGEEYPVIIFLHGAGTRGNDIDALINNPFFKITDNHDKFPFITVAPLCSANTWFDLFETLKDFTVKISREKYTDIKRIYVMGASMGGYASWQLAMSMPEYFAAAVPICGGGMYWNAGRLVNVHVWAFHGGKDNVVFCEESKKMTDAVNRNGGHARLTVYPENTHDAWSDTYSNYEVFEWLLENQNANTSQMQDSYNDSKIYG